MLVFFSTVAAKSIQIFIMVTLLSFGGVTKTVIKALVSPAAQVSVQQEAEKDTLSRKEKTAEEEKDKPVEIKKYKSDKKRSETDKKSNLKISISDKGVKIGSSDGEEVILDIDKARISEGLEKVFDDIDGIKINLDDLDDPSEYIDFDFLNIEERDFKVVRTKELVRFGDDVHIGRNELVRGDVVVLFGDIEIDGKVTGDVVSVLGDVKIGPTAIVNGEVVSVLGRLDEDPRAHVRGETIEVWSHHNPISVPFFAFGGGIFRVIAKFVSFLVGALLLLIILYFLPDRMRRSSEFIFGSFFKALGVGLLVLFIGGAVVGLIGVILSITIIGIPVAILLVLSFGALVIVGYFVSALALGRFIVSKFNLESDSIFIQGIIGLFGLMLLGILSGMLWFAPYFLPARIILKSMSAFLNFIALFTGVGAFILSKAGQLTHGARLPLPEPDQE
ncbi:MAG: hypothetical protein JW814_08390 [Candidatus Krumholzibacteriota bacterium]|nr:hypothetical protein [Candidatus Krumholzibacteriota bacterium]